MQYDPDSDIDPRPESGELGLCVAILQRAVEDHRYGKPRQRADAREFFAGAWFSMLAEGVGLDVDAVRERLRARRML